MLKMRTRKRIADAFTYAALILISLFFLLPILWVLRTSLVTKQIAYQIPPDWSAPFTLDNYITIFRENNFGQYFLNSSPLSPSAS